MCFDFFQLKRFDDSQKFMLINYISKSIFDGIVSGKVNFGTPEVKQLLLDGFQVIELPEAKLQLDEGVREDDDEGDLPPEELQKMAKKTIRVMFCHAFVQEIMPKFMDMSRFLAKIKSPLQKEFRNCLAVIAEAYPDELHLLFKDSAQLKLEIEADLKLRRREARKSRMERNKVLVNHMAQDVPEKENVEPVAVKVEPKEVEEMAVELQAQNLDEKEKSVVVEVTAIAVDEEVQRINAEQAVEENEKTLVENEEIPTEKNKDQEDEKVEEKQQEEQAVPINEIDKDDSVFEGSSLHTAVEPSSPSQKDTPGTPAGPPKKRRKSEISIHLLQSMRKDKSMRLASMAHLDAVEPNLSPRVTASSIKRIHSTPKRTDTDFFDFTFGGDLSMIAPLDQTRFTSGKKRAR